MKSYILILILLLIPSVSAELLVEVNSDVSLVKGTNEEFKLYITNQGFSDRLEIQTDLEDFLYFKDKIYDIKLGEHLEVPFLVSASDKKDFGEYKGNIIVISNRQKNIVPFTVKIISDPVKLKTNLNIPQGFRKVYVGENTYLLTEVFNLGKLRNFDVYIYYSVFDNGGKKIFEEHETAALDTRFSLARKIPSPLSSGNYTARVEIVYSDDILDSSEYNFEVLRKSSPIVGAAIVDAEVDYSYYGFLFFAIFSFILLVYILINRKSREIY